MLDLVCVCVSTFPTNEKLLRFGFVCFFSGMGPCIAYEYVDRTWIILDLTASWTYVSCPNHWHIEITIIGRYGCILPHYLNHN